MWIGTNPFWLIAFGAGLALVGVSAIALAWWLCRLADRYIQGLVQRHAALTTEAVSRANAEASASKDAALATALERARADTQTAIALAKAEGEASVVNMRVESEKRGAIHWGAVKAAEAVTDIAVLLATDIQVQQARLDNLLLRVDWIRAGGNPDANWNEVVQWHNDGRKKKQ